MRILRWKRLPLLVSVIAAGVLATGAVSAVVFQQTISDTGNLHLRVVKTVASGFDSGWHVHPGIAVVQVQEGSFQLYQGSCTPTTLITSGGDPPQIPVGSYYNDPNYNPCPSVP